MLVLLFWIMCNIRENGYVLLLFRYGDLHTGKCCFTLLEVNTKDSSLPFEEHEDEDIQSGTTGSDASPLWSTKENIIVRCSLFDIVELGVVNTRASLFSCWSGVANELFADPGGVTNPIASCCWSDLGSWDSNVNFRAALAVELWGLAVETFPCSEDLGVSMLNLAISFRSFSLGGGLRFFESPPLGLLKYDTIDASSKDFVLLRTFVVGKSFFKDSSS